ncbi:TPA: PTS mannose/fructose/sorbose transporter subunit IIC, partial [Escherichia coli]|nr:PTS mannose/fructose/sorbose transporter subunit IIC [Escherichia coli]HBN2121777.1 PTS mannose/fructose/sorbose transporter subunit IIC [Escherichia coli]
SSAGGYLDLSLLAFGGVGVIMALLYIQLNPQWRKAEPHPQTTTITALDQLDD